MSRDPHAPAKFRYHGEHSRPIVQVDDVTAQDVFTGWQEESPLLRSQEGSRSRDFG